MGHLVLVGIPLLSHFRFRQPGCVPTGSLHVALLDSARQNEAAYTSKSRGPFCGRDSSVICFHSGPHSALLRSVLQGRGFSPISVRGPCLTESLSVAHQGNEAGGLSSSDMRARPTNRLVPAFLLESAAAMFPPYPVLGSFTASEYLKGMAPALDIISDSSNPTMSSIRIDLVGLESSSTRPMIKTLVWARCQYEVLFVDTTRSVLSSVALAVPKHSTAFSASSW